MSSIIIKICCSILIGTLLFACNPKVSPSADVLLQKGLKAAKQKKYESCIYNLGKIDDVAPYSNNSKISTPVLIYCHYMQGGYEEVEPMIDNFESVYPNNEQLPYVYYLRGLSHFRMLKNHKKSLNNVESLLLVIKRLDEIAPESKYAQNLNKLRPFLLDVQRKHAMYIAQNYVVTHNFIAAASRYANLYELTLNGETEKMIEKSMDAVLLNLGIQQ